MINKMTYGESFIHFKVSDIYAQNVMNIFKELRIYSNTLD